MSRDTRGTQAAAAYLHLLSVLPEELRLLANQLPAMLAVTNSKGAGIFFNSPLVDYLGRDADTLPGWGWLECIHPEDRERTKKTWQQALIEGRSYRNDVRLLRVTDDSHRWHRVEAVPLIDQDGSVFHWLCILSDVDDQVGAARRQAALAELGLFALESHDRVTLMQRATHLVAEALDVELCKVLKLLPDRRSLLLKAGVGWRPGLVGSATVGTDLDSQAGYTLQSQEPIVVEDLRKEKRFSGPRLLHEHGVVSGLSVIIQTPAGPYGVMGAHTSKQRDFSQDEVSFLQGVANVLGEAVRHDQANLALSESLRKEEAARREVEATNQRLTFLAEASHLLASSLEVEATLRQVAQLAVPGMADWCAVDLLNAEGTLERLVVAHEDPEKIRWANELHQRYPPEPDDDTGVYHVLRTGQPQYFPEIPKELLITAARDGAHLEILRQVGFSSAIVAPLVSRGRSLGALTLVHAESGRRYSERDVELASQLAQRAGVAVDNAQLYTQAQLLNAELEARVEHRTAELEEANRRLEVEVAESHRSQQRFQRLLQAAPDAIVIADASGRVVLSNTQTRELFGYEPSELLGQPLEVLMPERYRSDHVGHRSGYVGQPHVRPMGAGLELFGRRKDGGEFPVEISLSPLEAEEGLLVMSAIRDISDRKRAEMAIRDLNRELSVRVAELQEANRELETFTYSASHDLRAPLRGINGYSDALLQEYGEQLDETAQHYLGRISAGASRMGVLIDDLLNLSRISRTQLRISDVHLSALSRSIIEELRTREPEREFVTAIEDGLVARADAGLLQVMVENLLGNAWKFTGKRENAVIAVGWSEQHQAFFVRDNGAGFDMAFANKLFVPFQRLHDANEYEGTGIGLATAQRIVKRHGGRIWAEGSEEEGATFYFTFPVRDSFGEQV